MVLQYLALAIITVTLPSSINDFGDFWTLELNIDNVHSISFETFIPLMLLL